ncbi:MAG TPA: hypothetical protein VG939_03825 [Caulobacteraceae bacterium]|nr:hypothetical protein [Caulobacteraceae bacterium]
MRIEDIDYAQSANTFLAVFLGAFLATLGGIVAGQVENRLHRGERERNAALLFGEVLTSLQTLLRLAQETRAIGDPYGPITMRMLRAARREIEVYDRNRETLYEIRSGVLRVQLHTLVLRLMMPLESLLDVHHEIGELRLALKARDLTAEERAELAETLAVREERREQGFDFIVETAQEIGPMADALGRLARHSFARYRGNAIGRVPDTVSDEA